MRNWLRRWLTVLLDPNVEEFINHALRDPPDRKPCNLVGMRFHNTPKPCRRAGRSETEAVTNVIAALTSNPWVALNLWTDPKNVKYLSWQTTTVNRQRIDGSRSTTLKVNVPGVIRPLAFACRFRGYGGNFAGTMNTRWSARSRPTLRAPAGDRTSSIALFGLRLIRQSD
jgi:hypothetical protein